MCLVCTLDETSPFLINDLFSLTAWASEYKRLALYHN